MGHNKAVLDDWIAELKTQIPKYVCNKVVWAAKILEIQTPTNIKANKAGCKIAILDIPDNFPTAVPLIAEYMIKHDPKIGGYFVVYEDGYQSFFPADVFETGYSLEQDPPCGWPT